MSQPSPWNYPPHPFHKSFSSRHAFFEKSLAFPSILSAFATLILWLLTLVSLTWTTEAIWPSNGNIRLLNLLLPLAATHLFVLAVIWRILTQSGKLEFKTQVGFVNFHKTKYWQLLLQGGAFYLLLSIMVAALPISPPPMSPIKQLVGTGVSGITAAVLMVALIAPLMEEILFRGLLQGALQRKFSFLSTMLVVSVVFTAIHILSFGLYLPALGVIFIASLILCYLRQRHQSLWPPVFFHAGFNLTGLLLLLAAISSNV